LFFPLLKEILFVLFGCGACVGFFDIVGVIEGPNVGKFDGLKEGFSDGFKDGM